MLRALLVLKQNKTPAWVAWVLRNRPDSVLCHVVRHPGGYLNAWRGRFQCLHGTDMLTRQNQERLRYVADAAPEWEHRFGDIDRMSGAEAELWFWRYSCEVIHRASSGSSRYHLIRDEDVVRDPFGQARSLYEECGLPWNERIEAWIEAMREEWRQRSEPWRRLLRPEDIELVERVLDGSLMQSWWQAR